MHRKLTLWGILALVVGGLFYMIFRPADQVYFLPSQFNLFEDVPELSGILKYNFPSFIHTFSFVMITIGFTRCRGVISALSISAAWLGIDSFMELIQSATVNSLILERIPAWFDSVPMLGQLRTYCTFGRFDTYDMYASCAGAVLGFSFFLLQKGGRSK